MKFKIFFLSLILGLNFNLNAFSFSALKLNHLRAPRVEDQAETPADVRAKEAYAQFCTLLSYNSHSTVMLERFVLNSMCLIQEEIAGKEQELKIQQKGSDVKAAQKVEFEIAWRKKFYAELCKVKRILLPLHKEIFNYAKMTGYKVFGIATYTLQLGACLILPTLVSTLIALKIQNPERFDAIINAFNKSFKKKISNVSGYVKHKVFGPELNPVFKNSRGLGDGSDSITLNSIFRFNNIE